MNYNALVIVFINILLMMRYARNDTLLYHYDIFMT